VKQISLVGGVLFKTHTPPPPPKKKKKKETQNVKVGFRNNHLS
jgi:hypothetical protein